MADRLTKQQRFALQIMLEQEKAYPDERSSGATYGETFRQGWPAAVHWRTAAALVRRGLVVVTYSDPYEGQDLALTDAGRTEADR